MLLGLVRALRGDLNFTMSPVRVTRSGSRLARSVDWRWGGRHFATRGEALVVA